MGLFHALKGKVEHNDDETDVVVHGDEKKRIALNLATEGYKNCCNITYWL